MRGVSKVEKTPNGGRPSVPINSYNPQDYVTKLDFNELPEDYREVLEIAICTLLDQDGGKVVLTGGAQSGKTFFGAQMIYSAERFMRSYGMGRFYPIFITRTDYNEFAPYIDSIGDYLRQVARDMDLELSDICVFTDHTDVAGRLSESGTDVKIVLEAPEPMYGAMMKAQATGMTSVWSGWEIINLSSLYLRRRELIDMVYAAQHDRLSEVHEIELKKKDILVIANRLLGLCEAMRSSSGDERNPYVMVSPSHVAMFARRFIQILSATSEPLSITKEDISDAVNRVFEHMSLLIEEAHHRAHGVGMDNGDDGSNISITASSPEEAKAAMEELGVQLSEEDEEDLYSRFGESAPANNSDFKGKFRSISTLEKSLKKAIIGQDRAIDKVIDSVSIPAAGMNAPKKPLRTMLFLGPTGVGKTELSLQLAKNLFTDPLNVIRLDMSEYSSEGATTSLFGSSPGYIGYSKDGGTLTREVAKNPHSLIILDEIEKAKPSTWDAFLQVLDAGRMTTGGGTVVDFSNCVIVMTSNLGTEEMTAKSVGFGDFNSAAKTPVELERIAKSALKKYFRLEFINRIDEIVVFDQLSEDSARKIVENELRNVSKLIESRGHSLAARTSTDILDSILKSSDFNQYGARDIQRTVQKRVSVPLAKLVLNAGKTPKKFKLQKSEGPDFAVKEA